MDINTRIFSTDIFNCGTWNWNPQAAIIYQQYPMHFTLDKLPNLSAKEYMDVNLTSETTELKKPVGECFNSPEHIVADLEMTIFEKEKKFTATNFIVKQLN